MNNYQKYLLPVLFVCFPIYTIFSNLDWKFDLIVLLVLLLFLFQTKLSNFEMLVGTGVLLFFETLFKASNYNQVYPFLLAFLAIVSVLSCILIIWKISELRKQFVYSCGALILVISLIILMGILFPSSPFLYFSRRFLRQIILFLPMWLLGFFWFRKFQINLLVYVVGLMPFWVESISPVGFRSSVIGLSIKSLSNNMVEMPFGLQVTNAIFLITCLIVSPIIFGDMIEVKRKFLWLVLSIVLVTNIHIWLQYFSSDRSNLIDFVFVDVLLLIGVLISYQIQKFYLNKS